MLRYFPLVGLLIALSLVGCTTTTDSSPALDLNSVRTILPTIDPEDISDYARLASDETLTSGQELYETNCAACHGLNGEGQFPDAPMQPDDTGRLGAPPHNGTGHTWHHDDDLLYEIVREGGVGTPDRFYPMPAFASQLSEDEIVAVIAYIKTFWTEEQRLVQAERTLLIRQQNQ